jgi:hypothetical protein
MGASMNLKKDVKTWWNSLSYDKKALTNKKYEKYFLDGWSHVVKKDKKRNKDLFSRDVFILHVHGCIQ